MYTEQILIVRQSTCSYFPSSWEQNVFSQAREGKKILALVREDKKSFNKGVQNEHHPDYKISAY